MEIVRIETTVIPCTDEGRKFAEDYIKRLNAQGALRGCKKDAGQIVITAKYYLKLIDAKDGENDED